MITLYMIMTCYVSGPCWYEPRAQYVSRAECVHIRDQLRFGMPRELKIECVQKTVPAWEIVR